MSDPVTLKHSAFVTMKHDCNCGGTVFIQNWHEADCSRTLRKGYWCYCDRCNLTGKVSVLKETITEPIEEAKEPEANA